MKTEDLIRQGEALQEQNEVVARDDCLSALHNALEVLQARRPQFRHYRKQACDNTIEDLKRALSYFLAWAK